MMKTEKHPFQPFLPEGAHILFLGSFPPQPHRWCMPFYYPNWINDFWRIMGILFFGDRKHFCIPGEKWFNEDAIREFCAREGLAFYDTACEVRRLRDNASDAFLEVVRATDIASLLPQIPHCRVVVTTGEKASQLVADWLGCEVPAVGAFVDVAGVAQGQGRARGQAEEQGLAFVPGLAEGQTEPRALRFWRMPSTSRAYPLPLEKKAEEYRKLF